VIVAVGIVAALAAIWHRARYRGRESRALEDVRGRLRRLQSADRQAKKQAEPPAPVELRLLREHVAARTLIGDRLEALGRMKQARAKANVAALQQMTVLRESASVSLALPGYAVDVSMMLGLLGTFIGLCMMLQQMQVVENAGANDPRSFTQAGVILGHIITSKKTAFATTLVGLACAISLSGLNFFLARAQSGFYDRLERFTTEELLPATLPLEEDETAAERLSLQLTDTFAQLGTLTEHHTQNLERLEAMETAFATIVDGIRTLTRQSARGPAEETSGALTAVVKQLAGANDALVKIAATVAPALKSFQERQDGAIAELGKLMTAQQAGIERILRAQAREAPRAWAAGRAPPFADPLPSSVPAEPWRLPLRKRRFGLRPALALLALGIVVSLLVLSLW
jgi:biopolymer transport protein ExbB/TolQ